MRRYRGAWWLLGLVVGWLVVGCVFVSGKPLPICKTSAECKGGVCILDESGEAFCGTLSNPKAGEQKSLIMGEAVFVVRWIPAGSFKMGSPSNEPDREISEGSQRTVSISRGYWLMESEATQGQYKALMGANPSYFSSCGYNCPVERVSWHDAALFANKASEKEGLTPCFACGGGECKGIGDKESNYLGCEGWRLPTEAEWEYAARAGTTTAFHTGKCISTKLANYNGNEPGLGCSKGAYTEKTMGVCGLSWNAWGLCDMSGNVSEWVYDGYGLYEGMLDQDPLRGSSDEKRVFRGGSWNDSARFVRSATRRWDTASNRHNVLGFRLLRY